MMKISPARNIVVIALLSFAVAFSACSKSNNLLFGWVGGVLGTHTVVITDCYRTSVPSPQASRDSVDGSQMYRFTPCKDAEMN